MSEKNVGKNVEKNVGKKYSEHSTVSNNSINQRILYQLSSGIIISLDTLVKLILKLNNI